MHKQKNKRPYLLATKPAEQLESKKKKKDQTCNKKDF